MVGSIILRLFVFLFAHLRNVGIIRLLLMSVDEFGMRESFEILAKCWYMDHLPVKFNL